MMGLWNVSIELLTAVGSCVHVLLPHFHAAILYANERTNENVRIKVTSLSLSLPINVIIKMHSEAFSQ